MRNALQKLGYGLLVVSGIIVLLTTLFFMFLSGDQKAAYEMTGQNTDQATIQKIIKEYALDAPVYKQVAYYINDLSPLSVHRTDDTSAINGLRTQAYSHWPIWTSDAQALVIKWPYFRRSYQTNRPVSAILAEALPPTLILAIAAMGIALILGIPLGIWSALKPNTLADKSILAITTMGLSFPSFFAAILLSWLGGYVLHTYTHLPVWGHLYEIDEITGIRHIRWSHLILPALTLGIRPLSLIIQLMRNSMLDVLRQDYMRTAVAKGLPPHRVILKHGLRNALNPLITAVSGWLGGLLAGAVFIEYIFGWKGMGKTIVDGLQKLDYPVVMGGVISVSLLFVGITLVVDVLYAWVDPRLRKK